MARLKALRKHLFLGKHLPGEIYEVEDKYVKFLTKIGVAELAPPPAPAKTAPKPKITFEAESSTRYKRRDMRPEK